MRHAGVPQKGKMGPREMNSEMVVVVVGPSLIYLFSKTAAGPPDPQSPKAPPATKNKSKKPKSSIIP